MVLSWSFFVEDEAKMHRDNNVWTECMCNAATSQTIDKRRDKEKQRKGGSVQSPPPNAHTTTKPFHKPARFWSEECVNVKKTAPQQPIHQHASDGSGRRGAHGLSAESELHALVARRKERETRNDNRKQKRGRRNATKQTTLAGFTDQLSSF
jgi:hypothetical protein